MGEDNSKKIKNQSLNNWILSLLFILLLIGSLNASGSRIGILALSLVIAFTNIFYFLRILYKRYIKISDIIILFLTVIYIIVSMVSSQNGLGNRGITNTFEFVACIGVYLYFSNSEWNNKVILLIYRISIVFVLFHFLVWIAKGFGREFSSIYPNSNILGPFMFIAIYFILLRIFTTKKHKISVIIDVYWSNNLFYLEYNS